MCRTTSTVRRIAKETERRVMEYCLYVRKTWERRISYTEEKNRQNKIHIIITLACVCEIESRLLNNDDSTGRVSIRATVMGWNWCRWCKLASNKIVMFLTWQDLVISHQPLHHCDNQCRSQIDWFWLIESTFGESPNRSLRLHPDPAHDLPPRISTSTA